MLEANYVCSGEPSKCRSCGNSKVELGEGCDDGNQQSNDGCSSTCVIESGYTCLTGSGTVSICSICGDGIKNGYIFFVFTQLILVRLEQCDDGNKNSSDGCSSSCLVESGWNCYNVSVGSPSICNEVCSDGIITKSEQCDTGKTPFCCIILIC